MTSTRSHTSVHGKHSRREFLRRSGMLAAVAGFGAPFALDLAGVSNSNSSSSSSSSKGDSDPASFGRGSDDGYRALVCVFMLGGNDHNATFIPYDHDSYAIYRRLRGDLAPERSDVFALGPSERSGRRLAFAPELGALRMIYEAGDLAVVSNVGTLRAPTTKKSFRTVTNQPNQLFSHNDQQTLWQSTQAGDRNEGWGGRLADLMLDANGDNSAFTCMSTAGVTTMMTGRSAGQFHVDASGVTELQSPFRSDAIVDGLRNVMAQSTGGMIADAYSDLTAQALQSSGQLAVALPGPSSRPFPNSGLGRQLAMVSRLVAAGRDQLGLKRQVFFVAAGGFDTHARHTLAHPPLLADLSHSLTSFRAALHDIGASDSVTTFTSSDFGRTLNTNGDGTDHGWGSHHIVMGGAVRGGKILGKLPIIADNGPDDVGRGRIVPTIAVDQYAATLARWMGADAEGIQAVAPNLDRFESADIGLFESSKGGFVKPETNDKPKTPTPTPTPNLDPGPKPESPQPVTNPPKLDPERPAPDPDGHLMEPKPSTDPDGTEPPDSVPGLRGIASGTPSRDLRTARRGG